MSVKTILPFNKKIDALIVGSEWSIDRAWGLQQLNAYVEQVEMISQNSSVGDLLMKTFKANKKRQQATIISPTSSEGQPLTFSSQTLKSFGGENQIPENSIAHLKLEGVMQMRSSLSTRGMDALCKDLAMCSAEPNIVAAIIEVDSGGGLSLAGQMVRNAVEDCSVPVVTYAHFIGSAAVNGTCPSEFIMLAGESSRIGSIGSMVSLNKRAIDWYKENYEDIYADVSPQKNKDFRDLLKGDKKLLKSSVTKGAISFQNAVKANRQLNPELQEDTLEGAMFPASDGINRGLADGVGTFKDAVLKASELAGLSSSRVPQAPLVGDDPEMEDKEKSNSLILNNNSMEIKDFIKVIAVALNSAFGVEVKDDASMEDVATTVEQLPTLLNNKVSETLVVLNDKINSLETQIENNKTAIAKTADLEASVTALEANVAELNSANEQLTKDKSALEGEVATLKGTPPPSDGGDTTVPQTAAEEVEQKIGGLNEIAGDEKY